MANFGVAVNFVLTNEGGFVDDKNDRGGATVFGISSQYLMNAKLWQYDVNNDGVIDSSDMRNFTKDNAISIYKGWWDDNGFDLLANVEIAKRAFDFAINIGQSTSVKVLQKTVNAVCNYLIIAVDGIIGIKTASAINSMDEAHVRLFLTTFMILRSNYYRKIVSNNPVYAKYLDGWLQRANK